MSRWGRMVENIIQWTEYHFIVGNKIVMTESHPVTWGGFIYHILLVKKYFLKQAFTLN
ncbi:hypothetical protein C8K15_105170 [Paenisporosarcina sp. OV554]|nr:hypothetical protein C8K15_105170 [Paenisporosarcina sp. OV554]